VGTIDLISKARAGDGNAFEELTQPYRRELHVHCYRMLGSFQDAEDVLQDTLLAAWQGLVSFEERASLRTWLYRIATNRCLNARRAAGRRQAKAWDVPGVEPPEPSRLGEVPWLQPYPDTLFEDVVDAPPGPEARYEQTESISLAFVTAIQLLPPRQLAVLVLRDVLGFHANEVADMLDSTVESVNSALKRARAGLHVKVPEVFISMPPLPFEYEGREPASRLFASIFGSGRKFDLVATRANGQPALGAYLRDATGVSHGIGLFVLTLSGDRICAMTRFENGVLPWFGLPRSLPSP
jgi:RNA polymerase sigma factor (sigma-70 family)